MNEMPLISVIIPIYKVEDYLNKCIESVRNQTYSNLEIILVDDGSPDRCGSICDEYVLQDGRIRVIHKTNGGLSDARNAGINIMQGEYVTFIDSDDFVSKYFVENLWMAIKKTDCEIATSWFLEYHTGDKVACPNRLQVEDIQVLNREALYEKLLYQDGVEVSAWGKLYRSKLFNGIRYPVGKLYEDIPTTYLLVEKTDKIAVIPNIDYYYFQRNNSIAQTSFSLKKMDAIKHMSNFKDFIIENYPRLEMAAKCRYFSTVCNILFLIPKSTFEEQRVELWKEVKKYRKTILLDKKGRKKARIAALLSYSGYNIMHFIYNKTQ